ncbi:hypothetical protein BRC82_00500 [Halobacteriales archaeon QS_1_67_19]|nr:MAG: hypothetical protein BRC82_00500 [Halobacteriales archaeon QS_1_67_19]
MIRDRDPRVRGDLGGDPPFEPWERAALNRGFRACVGVPLVYDERVYGVLGVCAEEPDAFDRLETAVLGELGEIIGYALNAVDRKRALLSDRSVELELRLRDDTTPLLQFAAERDCEFAFRNIVPRTDEPPVVLFELRGVAPETVAELGRRTPEIEEPALVQRLDDGGLFESRLADSGFLATLVERGAIPQALTANGSTGRAVIRVAPGTDVRSLVELFETQYGSVELVARRTVDEPLEASPTVASEFRTRLTDRQEEILRMAHDSGFFKWPRSVSAQDLAELLDVTQPTVSRHVRAGERELFDLVFDEG